MSEPHIHERGQTALRNSTSEADAAIQFRSVSIIVNDGRPLVDSVNFGVVRGETLVLLG